MWYKSLNGNAPRVRFNEAVIRGIAPDRGLYFPTEIPRLSKHFWETLKGGQNTAEQRTMVLHKYFEGILFERKTLGWGEL